MPPKATQTQLMRERTTKIKQVSLVQNNHRKNSPSILTSSILEHKQQSPTILHKRLPSNGESKKLREQLYLKGTNDFASRTSQSFHQ